jgi:3'(2'), 5'-bisphosphate nucleotidase
MTKFLDLARELIPLVKAAGEIELKYYRAGAVVSAKADGSPVTLADQEAEALIIQALGQIVPGIPVVGEESVAAGHIPDISCGEFFLVDALDGTKEFISGGGDFTVNIALMQKFMPVMGIIYAPVSGALYIGAGDEAYIVAADGKETRLNVRVEPDEGMTVVASRRHDNDARIMNFLKPRKVNNLIKRSSSLKFCAVAAGEADIYPRLGNTSEWDTAAGEAILNAAGGRVTTLEGGPMIYGKADRNFLNPAFVAFAAAA